jgi:hypothetical protein
MDMKEVIKDFYATESCSIPSYINREKKSPMVNQVNQYRPEL